MESIFRSYWPDYEPIKLLYHPKWKPRRGGGLRQINSCRQVHLQVNFEEKPTFRIGVYLVIWSMTIFLSVCGSRRVCSLQIVPAPMNHMVRPVTLPSGSTDQVSAPDPPPPHSIHVLLLLSTFILQIFFSCLHPSVSLPASFIYQNSIQSSFLQFYSSNSLKRELKKESPGLSIPKYWTTSGDTQQHC